MQNQLEVNERNRSLLVDWIVDVSVKFKILNETLFLCVNILDRFLQNKIVPRAKFQLVGITSMLIACKFEEIFIPEIKDFTFISGKAYTEDEILKMEKTILIDLDFNLGTPTALHFLRRYSKAAKSDSKIHTLSKYIIELSLLDYAMLKYLPSTIAAASIYIARKMCNVSPAWDSTLTHYSQYSEHQLIECAKELNQIIIAQEQSKYKAIYKKYSQARFLFVASIQPTII